MHVDVNGTRLWFDVEGPSHVPRSRAGEAVATAVSALTKSPMKL